MNPPLRYFGGKAKLADTIIRLFPPHKHYVEPFAGGLAVFFKKPPSEMETINDLDGNVINFYRVLAEPDLRGELIERALLTPYSRQVFEECRAWFGTPGHRICDPLERAYRFLIWNGMSYAGSMESWSFSVGLCRKDTTASVSVWKNRVAALLPAHERLLNVQIECQDFRHILRRYDSFETFFYLDPPYVPETRVRGEYQHEMTREDHEDLVRLLLDLKGSAILSGYRTEVYRPLDTAGWDLRTVNTVSYASTCGTTGMRPKRTECLWINPAARSRFLPGLFEDRETAVVA